MSYAQVAKKYDLKGRETVCEWVMWLQKGEFAPLTQEEMTERQETCLGREGPTDKGAGKPSGGRAVTFLTQD